jgi:Na+/H+-dicarboxylate symporter
MIDRRLGLGSKIGIAMAVGGLLGAVLGERVAVLQPVGDLFIRLLVLAAVPLVFFNLAAGLTALTDVSALGRIAARILAFFAVTGVTAVLVGAGAMALLRPGVGMTLRAPVTQQIAEPPTVVSVILDLFPTNAVQAFAQGNVLQVVVLAVVVGLATLELPEGPRDRLRTLFGDVAALMRKVVDFILAIAPTASAR